MTRSVTVHKLNERGQQLLEYSGSLVSQGGNCLVLEAFFEPEELDLCGVRLRRGDRFVETYYTDRWYNIFTIYDRDNGRLKGWYCNITRPARISPAGDHVYAEDLALDLIVFPHGRWMVVDEEEFAALSLTLEERQQALGALADLQAKVVRREGPFEALAGAVSAPG
jgi:hypothetical protein